MSQPAADSEAPSRDSDDGGAVSSERAVRCPCCGGDLAERRRAGNPFLSVKPAVFIVCVDCGLDGDLLERAANAPW
ncbi:MAG TPA: hypothetical protein VGM56_02840 [Byssovorax sp.]|jgi:hypothetical protein